MAANTAQGRPNEIPNDPPLEDPGMPDYYEPGTKESPEPEPHGIPEPLPDHEHDSNKPVISHKISAIISSERHLEQIRMKLVPTIVGQHDITVQGAPAQVADQFGTRFVSPQKIKSDTNPPKKEPFLEDDFGWVLGFSFSIPLIIGIIIGMFVMGDVQEFSDNVIYGIAGALIGGGIGLILSLFLRNNHLKNRIRQEEKGGFAVWITVYNEEQVQQTLEILKKYDAKNVTVE